MAITVKNITFSIAQLLEAEKFILVSQSEKAVFKDGKPTDEKYTVAEVTTAESGFEKISVKPRAKELTSQTRLWQRETATSILCSSHLSTIRLKFIRISKQASKKSPQKQKG